METRPLICSANQWTGFCMITAFVMKGLKVLAVSYFSIHYRHLLFVKWEQKHHAATRIFVIRVCLQVAKMKSHIGMKLAPGCKKLLFKSEFKPRMKFSLKNNL